FVPSPLSPSIDLHFLPFNAKIVASSEQGIIVLESLDPKNHRNVFYNICKPATKQLLRLPYPKTRYRTEKVAIIVMGSKMTLRYKIVRLSNPKFTGYTLNCEIFDSKRGAWGPLNLIRLPYGVFLTNSQAITARGYINMLLTNGDVLMFDAHQEKWTRVSSPVPTLDECQFATPTQLLKYSGKLGIAWKPLNASWEIWILTHDQSFKKLHVFSKKEDSERESLLALYDSDTSVMVDHNTLIFHRFKRGKNISKFVMSDHPYQIFNFRSDFELVDFGFLITDNGGQEKLWNKLVPKKVNIFIWRALRGIIPVGVELDKRGVDLDSVLCPSCDKIVETCAHCLITCDLAMSVWVKIFNWWNVGIVNAFTIDEVFSSNGNINVPDYYSLVWQAVIWTTGYFIWRERNARVFGKKVSSTNKIVKDIQLKSFEWIVRRSNKYKERDWQQWLWDPLKNQSK
ncbi:RNA-directed DNA polymerase, eukaryota, reverse transcriptase zinc-binding domain protein, partial [Tanacetum coccineum]